MTYLVICWEVSLKVLGAMMLRSTAGPPTGDGWASSGEVFAPVLIHVFTLEFNKHLLSSHSANPVVGSGEAAAGPPGGAQSHVWGPR